MWPRSIGTRPYFNAVAALRLIDLVQDVVQLLLGQDVEIHQSDYLDPHHHGKRGIVIVLFSGGIACGCGHTLQDRSDDRSTHWVAEFP